MKENICINCKRCVNSREFHCNWSEFGTPVEGWTATKSKVYKIPRKDGTYREEQGYHITACPQYIQDHKYFTHKDIEKQVAKTLNLAENYVAHHWRKILKRYEEVSGETLPKWAYIKTKKVRAKNVK